MNFSQKVALVGCGNITASRHIPALKNVQKKHRIDFFSVIGVNSEQIENAAKLSGAKVKVNLRNTRWEELDWANQIDLFVVGTPPETHLEILEKITQTTTHSKILIEKPFVIDKREFNELSLGKHSERIAVMHNFQFSFGFLKAKRIIETGKLGEIISIQGFQSSTDKRRLPDWYDSLPLGLFTDESSHFFYLIENLIGEIEVLGARKILDTRRNTPHIINIELLGKSGVPGSITMNFSGGISEWGILIHGTERTLVFDMFRDIVFSLPNDGLHLIKNISLTSMYSILGHVLGFGASGIRHLRGKLLFGVDTVLDKVLAEPNLMHLQDLNVSSALRTVEYMSTVRSLVEA